MIQTILVRFLLEMAIDFKLFHMETGMLSNLSVKK